MKRSTLNYLVELSALLILLGLVWTGLLMYRVLPPGSRGGRGLRLWGMDRHQFGDIHLYLAITLIVLLTLHVWLHWRWVYETSRRLGRAGPAAPSKRSSRVLGGLVLLIVLVLLVVTTLLWAESHVASGGDRAGRRYGRGQGQPIRAPAR